MSLLSRRLDGLEMPAIASDFFKILVAASAMVPPPGCTCAALETWMPGSASPRG